MSCAQALRLIWITSLEPLSQFLVTGGVLAPQHGARCMGLRKSQPHGCFSAVLFFCCCFPSFMPLPRTTTGSPLRGGRDEDSRTHWLRHLPKLRWIPVGSRLSGCLLLLTWTRFGPFSPIEPSKVCSSRGIRTVPARKPTGVVIPWTLRNHRRVERLAGEGLTTKAGLPNAQRMSGEDADGAHLDGFTARERRGVHQGRACHREQCR